MDGVEVIAADVVQLDFLAEQFDRRVKRNDPPVALLFEAVNGFISRYRTLCRAFQVAEVNPTDTTWRIDFLNDDETPFEAQEGYVRARAGATFHFDFVSLPGALWDRIHELPIDYRPPPWDQLILDAFARLPHVGAAIVLGFTALEVRIEAALNELARLFGVRPDVWEWLNDRGDYRKEPSTVEQFDSLLKSVTGRTLKEDNRLWEAFQNLRKARNAFAHDGVASIGEADVDLQRATELLQQAGEILDWVEGLLPETSRRPRYEVVTNYEQTTMFVVEPLDQSDTGANPEGE